MASYSLDLESGSSQYASVADEAELSITDDLSIEAWLKAETVAASAIVSKWHEDGKRSYKFSLNADGKLTFETSYSGNGGAEVETWITDAAQVVAGVWKHVAMTFDRSAGDVVFYVNGAVVASTAAIGSVNIHDNASAFAVGAYQDVNSAWQGFFDGKMDDVRLWSDIRTITEIQANRLKELVGNEAGLVGYWKLNNGYTDGTANANTLTASGAPVFSLDVPFTAGGLLMIM